MENSSLANLDHLLGCRAALPCVPPQLRLSLASTISRIREVNKVELREQTETCGYCFSDIDLARDEVELVKRKKAEPDILKITCHTCKKVCKSKEIEKIPERKTEVSVTTETETMGSNIVIEATENHTKKKKKRKKDDNAGLIIPVSKKTKDNFFLGISKTSTITATPSPKTVSASKSKLKMLMSKSEAPQRGGLQDFLKRL